MVKSKEEKKADILNILIELSSSNDIKYCANFTLKQGDEIKISIMKVDEKDKESEEGVEDFYPAKHLFTGRPIEE